MTFLGQVQLTGQVAVRPMAGTRTQLVLRAMTMRAVLVARRVAGWLAQARDA